MIDACLLDLLIQLPGQASSRISLSAIQRFFPPPFDGHYIPSPLQVFKAKVIAQLLSQSLIQYKISTRVQVKKSKTTAKREWDGCKLYSRHKTMSADCGGGGREVMTPFNREMKLLAAYVSHIPEDKI